MQDVRTPAAVRKEFIDQNVASLYHSVFWEDCALGGNKPEVLFFLSINNSFWYFVVYFALFYTSSARPPALYSSPYHVRLVPMYSQTKPNKHMTCLLLVFSCKSRKVHFALIIPFQAGLNPGKCLYSSVLFYNWKMFDPEGKKNRWDIINKMQIVFQGKIY